MTDSMPIIVLVWFLQEEHLSGRSTCFAGAGRLGLRIIKRNTACGATGLR